ncbi:hypothetical protein Tco_1314576 [Tanacetum coccineum]
MVDEQMVVPAVDEIAEQLVVPAIKEAAELVVEAEEEQDLAVLFGDDDFEDDASDGFGEEEVWEVNEDWLMAPTTPPPVLAVPPPSVYEVGGPSTAVAKGQSFPQGSDAEIAAGVTIGEIGRVGSADFYPERRDNYRIDSAGSGLAGRCATERHTDLAAADYYYRDEQIVDAGRFLKRVEDEMVSPVVESEKWRRPLLHWMYDALNVSTDGREEDFFPQNEV